MMLDSIRALKCSKVGATVKGGVMTDTFETFAFIHSFSKTFLKMPNESKS